MSKHVCFKCGNNHVAEKEVGTTGTGIARMFDREQTEFKAVYCTKCGYTEFYTTTTDQSDFNLRDLFFKQ